MIEIRRIGSGDALYPQACDLRERVLLRPIGKDMEWFREQYAETESRAEHFVAVFDHPSGPRVIGVVLLIPGYPEEGAGKLAQMAVDPQRQGEGIGRRMVVALEMRAFGELGLSEVFCHAQESAVGFYDKLGWETEGEPFEEAGIPHSRMLLRQPVIEED